MEPVGKNTSLAVFHGSHPLRSRVVQMPHDLASERCPSTDVANNSIFASPYVSNRSASSLFTVREEALHDGVVVAPGGSCCRRSRAHQEHLVVRLAYVQPWSEWCNRPISGHRRFSAISSADGQVAIVDGAHGPADHKPREQVEDDGMSLPLEPMTNSVVSPTQRRFLRRTGSGDSRPPAGRDRSSWST